MKNLIIILLLIPFTLRGQENWSFKKDNMLHFGAGGVIVIVALPLMNYATNDLDGSTNGAFWTAIACGAGKEVLDLLKWAATGKGGGASESDFVYTVAGAMVFALLTKFIIIRFKKWKKRKWDKKFNIEF